MSLWRYKSTVAVMWLCFAALHDLPSCSAQVAAPNLQDPKVSTDTSTRWGFQTVSPATINSQIIRLADVVKPLDPSMAGWQRLQRLPIGLVPIDGQAMTIGRDRLAKAIRNAAATPLVIDWFGTSEIKVLYRKPAASEVPRHPAGPAVIAQVDHTESVNPKPNRNAGTDVPNAGRGQPTLSESEAKRAVYWIEHAIKRLLPSVLENYRIEIDRRHSGLVPLSRISGVTAIEPHEQIHEGRCRFHVVGRSSGGAVESDIDITLTAHPTVVVPRKHLPRGHQIEPHDLEFKSIPGEEVDAGFVTDPSELIDLEVRRAVRASQPINRDDVGTPILVHRGDKIEVRVVGGGISITTDAKSLEDGALSELIEIETMQPRKRLVARVINPGMVEIVTRAPRVTR